MEDKKNNIGTDLDISIEDILADPTLGVSEEGTSGEKDPAYKLVNGFIVESTEGAEEEKPLVIDQEQFIKEPVIGVREYPADPVPKPKKSTKKVPKEIKEPILPKEEPTPSKEEPEPKELVPSNMEVLEDNVPIVNDSDELLQGETDPDSVVKQLMEDPTKNDKLYVVLKQEENTGVLLTNVMQEISEELAYQKAYRKIQYLANEDISELSLKRTKSLEVLVKALVERDKLKQGIDGKIDFYGEKFEKIMEFILTVVKDAFEKVGIPEQFNDIFFVQLAQDLEGFEKKVEKIYYGVPTSTKSKK